MVGSSISESDNNAKDIINCLSKDINGLTGDSNQMKKKRCLKTITSELLKLKMDEENSHTHAIVLKALLRNILCLFSDQVEGLRQSSIDIICENLENIQNVDELASDIFPVLVNRLGTCEIIETSEEVRRSLVQLLVLLLNHLKSKSNIFLEDVVKILKNTIIDPYPEVKKDSCKCCILFAEYTKTNFHMMSEPLIKPLLECITHKHSKVRVTAIEAVGAVIQYGNVKSLDDVLVPLARGLFDEIPSVRLAVLKISGSWLLELLDRYSYFHKLLPLVLLGLIDEFPDIQNEARSLWHDIGLKYLAENEDELKDKQYFDCTPYPTSVERSNLGCRELMYRNFSKILPGVTYEITDWIPEKRIKAAQLLYTMLLNNEVNVTQHLDKVLRIFYSASRDEESKVVEYISKSAELIGYFVKPDVWCPMILTTVKSTEHFGPLLVLSAILAGSDRTNLKSHLRIIFDQLKCPSICHSLDPFIQKYVFASIESLMNLMDESVFEYSEDIFYLLICTSALNSKNYEHAISLLDKLRRSQNFDSIQDLYRKHIEFLMAVISADSDEWTKYSLNCIIFEFILLNTGAFIGEILGLIFPIIVNNTNPNKDPEVRHTFLTLLSKLLIDSNNSLNSSGKLSQYMNILIDDIILPNLNWQPGKTAIALRNITMICLMTFLENNSEFDVIELSSFRDTLLTKVLSMANEDNVQTRKTTCIVLRLMFERASAEFHVDQLFQMSPTLIKCLDDSSDEVRISMTSTLISFFNCLDICNNGSDHGSHFQYVFSSLLIHLDDANCEVQDAVLELLQKCCTFCPEILLNEIEQVRHKHRSEKYLNILVGYVRDISK